jgi:hypothetical protein
MNPENNARTRAYLYAMGLGGSLHFITDVYLSVKQHNLSPLNTFSMLNWDVVFHVKHNWLTFIAGWVFWIGLGFFFFYLILRRSRTSVTSKSKSDHH